jgi:hypothetical protein
LPTLSDDEVAALSPLVPAERRLVPLVTHAGLDETARRKRVLAGARSLVDRGLLQTVGDERTSPSPELTSILTVRDKPLSVTIVDLARDGAIASCYAYGLGDPAFLLTETVDEGRHAFAIRTPVSIAASLAGELDPGVFAAGDGPELVQTAASTPPGWDELRRAAEAATGTLRLYAVHRTERAGLVELHGSAVVTPGALWLVAGTVDRATGDGAVTARTVSRQALETVLRSFLTLDGIELPAAD